LSFLHDRQVALLFPDFPEELNDLGKSGVKDGRTKTLRLLFREDREETPLGAVSGRQSGRRVASEAAV